ncbi:MAG: glycosyl hydrolase family 28-related protein [Armatimonadota bacterium]|nr:glycoside hydrolase family 55 protein [bacterium]
MPHSICKELVLVLLFGFLLSQMVLAAGESHRGHYNVDTFGAKGDGKTDNTKSFQKALDAASKDGGGIVDVPTGQFLIKGHLNIPKYVTLKGTMQAPPAAMPVGIDNRTEREISESMTNCSTLLAVENKGNEDGTPFIQMNTQSTITGIRIYYPDQNDTNPIQYPWCIRGSGDNNSLINVMVLNPWKGVDFGTKEVGRHYIHGLYGQPLKVGLYISRCYDVGRVEDVHFWCFWSLKAQDWTRENGVAFMISRTDFQFVSNSFCWMYHIGFLFTTGDMGPAGCGGVMLTNCSADGQGLGVVIEDSQWHAGITFNNSFIWGKVIVKPTNHGLVRFNTCTFNPSAIDPAHNIEASGNGDVSFNQCNFIYRTTPSIVADCRALNVSSCEFMALEDCQDRPKDYEAETIQLGAKLKGATILGNRFRMNSNVKNESQGKVAIDNNIVY